MDKVSGSKEDLLNTPERTILANYPIKQIAILAYLAAFLITFATDPAKWYCVATFGAAGWLYAKPIAGRRLKDIPGLKGPYVAATWAFSFASLVGAGYALIFLLILINTIIFDIRDLKGDETAGVRTIPAMVGFSRTIRILAALDGALAVIHLPSAIIGVILILYFRKQRATLEYDYLVDGWVVMALTSEILVKYIYCIDYAILSK
jgi:hypothetical protein